MKRAPSLRERAIVRDFMAGGSVDFTAFRHGVPPRRVEALLRRSRFWPARYRRG